MIFKFTAIICIINFSPSLILNINTMLLVTKIKTIRPRNTQRIRYLRVNKFFSRGGINRKKDIVKRWPNKFKKLTCLLGIFFSIVLCLIVNNI